MTCLSASAALECGGVGHERCLGCLDSGALVGCPILVDIIVECSVEILAGMTFSSMQPPASSVEMGRA